MTAILLSLLCTSILDESIPDAVQDRVLRATVRIEVERTNGIYFGTGTVFHDDNGAVYILTARHLLRDDLTIEVQFWPHDEDSHTSVDVTVLALSARQDIAILEVQTEFKAPAVLPIAIGELPRPPFQVCTTGCDQGPPSLALGQIVATDDLDADLRGTFWLLDIHTGPGRSGGPVVGSDGSILGVCYGHRGDMGLYIHRDEIAALIRGANLDGVFSLDPEPRNVDLLIESVHLSQPNWIEPERFLATSEALLRLTLKQSTTDGFPEPLLLTVTASTPAAATLSPVSVSVAEPGTTEILIPLDEVTLSRPTQVDFAVTVDSPPSWATCSQTNLEASLSLPMPPRVSMRLAAVPMRVRPLRWTNLNTGTAEIEIYARFSLVGPLDRSFNMNIDTPVDCRALSPTSVLIGPTVQTIHLTMLADLRPDQLNQFQITVPDRQIGAIDIRADPIRISVAGPPPVRIALAQADEIARGLSLVQSTPDGRAVISATPVLHATDPPAADWTGDVIVRASPNLQLQFDDPATLGTPLSLCVRPAEGQQFSYFRDTPLGGDIFVDPAQTGPAIVGSQHPVEVVVQARFKQHLAYTLGVLFVLTISSFSFVFLRRLYEKSSGTDGAK